MRHHPRPALRQHLQDAEGLRGEGDRTPLARQLVELGVEDAVPEAQAHRALSMRNENGTDPEQLAGVGLRLVGRV